MTKEELEAAYKADGQLVELMGHVERFEKELAEIQSQIVYIAALKNRREAVKRRLRGLASAVRRRQSMILQREVQTRIHSIQKDLGIPPA